MSLSWLRPVAEKSFFLSQARFPLKVFPVKNKDHWCLTSFFQSVVELFSRLLLHIKCTMYFGRATKDLNIIQYPDYLQTVFLLNV